MPYFMSDFDTDSSTPKCKNVRCRVCSEVATVDVEIKLAVANLQRLLTKRCDLRSEQNSTHNTMRRLPLELKSRIFELVLPTRDEWESQRWRKANKLKMPLFLTSICSNWRDIARSNPFLWSTIPIILGTPSTSDSNWVNFVYEWIQRSRNLPLNLYIGNCEYSNLEDEFESQLNNVLNVMAQCPNEWQCLSLNFPSPFLEVFQGGDNDFKSHLLTVKTLRITYTGDWDIQDIDQPVQPTMSPEKIEIHFVSFKSLPISWNHLTSAEVHYWDLEGVTHLFQHASQLIYCSIFWPQDDSDFAWSPITHRMLQTLCLRYSEDHTPMLLDSFTFPSLRAIETDIGVVALLPSLVRRSSCPLTRVTILEVVELTSDLQPLPGVTDLVLKMHDDAMLRALLLEGYLPDLQRLTLSLESFVILWKMGVVPMMLDRDRPRPDVVPLCNIVVVDRLGVSPMWDSDFADQLKAFRLSLTLREDGFEVLMMPEVQRSDEDS